MSQPTVDRAMRPTEPYLVKLLPGSGRDTLTLAGVEFTLEEREVQMTDIQLETVLKCPLWVWPRGSRKMHTTRDYVPPECEDTAALLSSFVVVKAPDAEEPEEEPEEELEEELVPVSVVDIFAAETTTAGGDAVLEFTATTAEVEPEEPTTDTE